MKGFRKLGSRKALLIRRLNEVSENARVRGVKVTNYINATYKCSPAKLLSSITTKKLTGLISEISSL